MKYEKPEVNLMTSAVNAIENNVKGDEPFPDNPECVTITAYVADE
jgi:hypothetical protein